MRLEQLARYGLRTAPRPSKLAPAAPPVELVLSGTLIERAEGTCLIVPARYPSDHRHGGHALQELAALAPRNLALISRDPDLVHLDMTRTVFLDTETTGLGLGVGTYVFLVGAGYLEGQEFCVQQFFLPGPDGERAFLAELTEFLQRFTAIVTFNGKAFDWPLLENRCVLHRRPAPLADPPHLDLLHSARRLWKRRLESCALSSLEREVLGFERTLQDVPGWQIPSLYFQYLQTGNAVPLRRVFYHNAHDVLSMAALVLHLDRVLSDPAGILAHGSDLLCLGRAYDRGNRPDVAIMCYDEALRRGLSPSDRGQCLLWLAALQKRQQLHEEARQSWLELRDEGGVNALIALVELAKHHEHVERDFDQALSDVTSALQLASTHHSSWPGCDIRDLERRRSRLLARLLGGGPRKRRRGKVDHRLESDWDAYADLRPAAGQER